MKLGLGIDTGGTYTDAAVVDFETRQVLHTAKTPTTKHDLSVGIARCIEALHATDWAQIRLVSLSTTLATNAIVEGRGGRVGLLLLGYDASLLQDYGLERELPVRDYHIIRGRFDLRGNEVQPLDVEQVRRIGRSLAPDVDAFAVSGYLSVMNPTHELAARDILIAQTGLPVACGHELTSALNSVRRAATCALNARLLPLIAELIEATKRAMARKGIRAPLLVVKGDGTLVSEAVARERPIDTVMSGPAASAVGGMFLSGLSNGLVVDMGGTTTDIARLHDGLPVVSDQGATVGGWRTCVRAADIRTAGLGGDSHVWLTKTGELRVGPRRVEPLCMAASSDERVVDELRRIEVFTPRSVLVETTDFLRLVRVPQGLKASERERLAIDALQDGPKSVLQVAGAVGVSHPLLLNTRRLEDIGVIQRIGFTPTDALHVLGKYRAWNAEASRIAARVYASKNGGDVQGLLRETNDRVVERLCLEILGKIAAPALGDMDAPERLASSYLIHKALERDSADGIELRLRVMDPIIAIGAPVRSYLPSAAEKLGAELVIPEHAEVANAVGAVAGRIVATIRLAIEPIYTVAGITGYSLVSPVEHRRFRHLQEAVEYATRLARERALEEAVRAGAQEPEVTVQRHDRQTETYGAFGGTTFLGTVIQATAVGKPLLL